MGWLNIGVVDGLNKVAINVWAICILGGGVLLALHGQTAVGSTLIAGGFALLRGEAKHDSPKDSKSGD